MNSRKNIVFFCIWVARPRHLDRWRLGETRAGTSGGEVFWGIRRRVSKHGRASIICNIQSSESSTLHSICDWLMGDLQFIQASIQNKHGWSSDTWRTLPCIIWTGPKWKVSIRYCRDICHHQCFDLFPILQISRRITNNWSLLEYN